MTEQRDRECLLNDILAEPGSGPSRELLLNRTLRAAAQRRVLRRVRRAGSALVVLIGFAFLVWRVPLPGPQPTGLPQSAKPYLLVQTRPLLETHLVITRPLPETSRVASSPTAGVALTSTRTQDRFYREIDDATLLALAADRPSVLVRLGPNSAELLFVSNPLSASDKP